MEGLKVRRVTSATFLSLDGVMQAPGGPEEDPAGGFAFGGWTATYWDEIMGKAMGENFANHSPFCSDARPMRFSPRIGLSRSRMIRCTRYSMRQKNMSRHGRS